MHSLALRARMRRPCTRWHRARMSNASVNHSRPGQPGIRFARHAPRFRLLPLGSSSTMEHVRRAKPGPRRWGSALLFVSILSGLLLVTAWNLTRSNALEEARRLCAGGPAGLPPACLGPPGAAALEPRSRPAGGALPESPRLRRPGRALLPRAGHLSLSDLQIRAYGMVRGPHPERRDPGLSRDPRARPAM